MEEIVGLYVLDARIVEQLDSQRLYIRACGYAQDAPPVEPALSIPIDAASIVIETLNVSHPVTHRGFLNLLICQILSVLHQQSVWRVCRIPAARAYG